MDKQMLFALSYFITDVRVHLFALINLLVEKGVISADEYDAMQKKCEISEGTATLKEIKRLVDKVLEEGREN